MDKKRQKVEEKQAGFIDWNELTIDQYIEHLEERFMLDSSGTAKAVIELIAAYKKLKSEADEYR